MVSGGTVSSVPSTPFPTTNARHASRNRWQAKVDDGMIVSWPIHSKNLWLCDRLMWNKTCPKGKNIDYLTLGLLLYLLLSEAIFRLFYLGKILC